MVAKVGTATCGTGSVSGGTYVVDVASATSTKDCGKMATRFRRGASAKEQGHVRDRRCLARPERGAGHANPGPDADSHGDAGPDADSRTATPVSTPARTAATPAPTPARTATPAPARTATRRLRRRSVRPARRRPSAAALPAGPAGPAAAAALPRTGAAVQTGNAASWPSSVSPLAAVALAPAAWWSRGSPGRAARPPSVGGGYAG
ncbi:MAG: hypothetical protein U0531_11555 [Dehalococcoidia bacterium]